MMNKFLKTIALFIGPLILILFIFELSLRSVETLYKKKIDGLIANADSIKVIALGDSHTLYGIDPLKLDLYTYNLAQVNQSLYFDKRIMLKYVDKLVNLKFVLISIDYHSLYFSSQGIRNHWSYYGNGVEYKNMGTLPRFFRLAGFTPKASFSFLKRKIFESKEINLRYPVDMDLTGQPFEPQKRGWIFFEGTDLNLQNNGCQSRANDFNKVVRNSVEQSEILADLDDFIGQLKQRNIIPILIELPVLRKFDEMLDETVRRRNEHKMAFIISKYDIEYWKSAEKDYTAGDFYDCDHLNKIGADKFSEELNLRLNHFHHHK